MTKSKTGTVRALTFFRVSERALNAAIRVHGLAPAEAVALRAAAVRGIIVVRDEADLRVARAFWFLCSLSRVPHVSIDVLFAERLSSVSVDLDPARAEFDDEATRELASLGVFVARSLARVVVESRRAMTVAALMRRAAARSVGRRRPMRGAA